MSSPACLFFSILKTLPSCCRGKSLIAVVAALLVSRQVPAVEPEFPSQRQEQILLAAKEFQQRGELAYIAFPALARTAPAEVLISYKHGRSHASDPGAFLEVIRFNTEDREIEWRGVVGKNPKRIYQMGEWMTFPNGRIGNFVDVQHVVAGNTPKKNQRTGVEWTFSDDRGRTFSPMSKLGLIDGVEYGYIFEGATVGETVYALAMSFPELTPQSRLVDDKGGRVYGDVSVIATSDNGKAWRFIKNLSREFGGIRINESSLLPIDGGFLVATRGYDSKLRLHRVDGEFHQLEQRTLTGQIPAVESFIGRPRLYERDGQIYLLGRNHRGKKMELANFRLNLKTLSIERMVVLDPADPAQVVSDGYYAMPYFQESPAGLKFNVITYRRFQSAANSDLIRLEFDWNEVR